MVDVSRVSSVDSRGCSGGGEGHFAVLSGNSTRITEHNRLGFGVCSPGSSFFCRGSPGLCFCGDYLTKIISVRARVEGAEEQKRRV